MQLTVDVNMSSIALIDGSCSSVSENISKTKNQTIMVNSNSVYNNGV